MSNSIEAQGLIIVKIIFLSLLMGVSSLALGFPELVRKGYLSCSTCHYSPSGAGLLTYYGKSIAQEVYSLGGGEKKEEANLEEETPWWRVGGQVRVMQLLTDSPSVQRARLFPMQSEIEAAVDKNQWSAVLAIGAWRPIEAKDKRLHSYVRNFYLLFRQSDNIQWRLGKFRTRFGLGLPDHTSLTTQGQGWTPIHETKNFEANYINEENAISAAYILPSQLLMTDESVKGVTFAFDRLLKMKHKVGVSLAQFTRDDVDEFQYNLNSVLSISDISYLQLEGGMRQIDSVDKLKQTGFMARYSREFRWGLRPFVQLENGLMNVSKSLWVQRSFIGTEWYPAAYFDALFSIGLEKQRSAEDNRIANFIGHFYF